MKKGIILLVIMVICLCIAGCGDADNELVLYEKHVYNKEKLRQEETIVKYNGSGKLKYLELTMIYDKETNTVCPDTTVFADIKYKDVKFICSKNDDGTVKIVTSLTDNSIKDGYLKNDTNRLTIKYEYNAVKSESKVRDIYKEQAEYLKNNGGCDSKNYFIIEGEKAC